jgi:hypothetical protein
MSFDCIFLILVTHYHALLTSNHVVIETEGIDRHF